MHSTTIVVKTKQNKTDPEKILRDQAEGPGSFTGVDQGSLAGETAFN